MILYIKIFELAVNIAILDNKLCQNISLPVIYSVFNSFFELENDPLS